MIGLYFSEAWGVLLGNRMRSLLTVTGLIIGVAAVIAIQVLGKGMSGAVGGVLSSVNDRSFFVIPSQRQGNFQAARLRPAEVLRVKREVPNIVEAIPAGGVVRLVRAGHTRGRYPIAGESDDRFITTAMLYGRNLTSGEIATSAHVATISNKLYRELFAQRGDVTGESVRVGDRRYLIVGVTDKPVSGLLSFNVGGDVVIPYTTYVKDYLRGKTVFGGRFLVRDVSLLAETEIATIKFLKSVHRGKGEYETRDRKQFSGFIDGLFAALTFVVALIGAVSLLVAGIGIMNMMLVSVNERTREIGIRKAIGARRGQILIQFFIEALLLSAVGCGIGLVVGLILGWTLNRFALIALSGVVAPIPWVQSVLIAVSFATIVTLVFGTYPAYRAARLDPIEALRYE